MGACVQIANPPRERLDGSLAESPAGRHLVGVQRVHHLLDGGSHDGHAGERVCDILQRLAQLVLQHILALALLLQHHVQWRLYRFEFLLHVVHLLCHGDAFQQHLLDLLQHVFVPADDSAPTALLGLKHQNAIDEPIGLQDVRLDLRVDVLPEGGGQVGGRLALVEPLNVALDLSRCLEVV